MCHKHIFFFFCFDLLFGYYFLYLLVENYYIMKHSKTILSLIVSVLLCSCVSFNSVTFERLEAGDVNYPESVRRVGVVNNMPYFDLAHLKHEVWDIPHLEGSGIIAADTLANLLALADYFDTVVVCDSMLQGKNTSFSEPYALSPLQADSLMEMLGVDVLFSLDRVKIDLSTWGQNGYGYRATGNKGVKSVVTPVLIAYIPGREVPWFAVSCKDSIGYNRNEPMSLGRFQKDASAYSAYMLMDHLLPSWKTVERTYYVSGCVEFRDANIYLMSENWNDAYWLWKQAYDTGKGKKKMMAAFNLAVYYEAHDDTNRALECLEEAITMVKSGSFDEGMMKIYRAQLKKRIEKRKKLEVQMKRFE